MKYLEAYLKRTRHPEKSIEPTPKAPTKPTEPGFDGFVGTQRKGIGPKRDLPQPEAFQAHNSHAREELDRHFSEVILPRLTDLHRAGKLPNLAHDPRWAEVEAEWNKAAATSLEPCNIQAVKDLMNEVISKWEAV